MWFLVKKYQYLKKLWYNTFCMDKNTWALKNLSKTFYE